MPERPTRVKTTMLVEGAGGVFELCCSHLSCFFSFSLSTADGWIKTEKLPQRAINQSSKIF